MFMKRESFVFLMLLLFQSIGVVLAGNELTVPVDGEALYNVVFTAQKQNQDGEAMLINALSKIYVKDVLKVTPVNAKGDRGTGVQPDIEIKGDTIKLRLGALLEFDLEKYKNGVLSPLQDVLKKVSLNGGERIDAKLYQKYQEKELRVNQQSWEYGNIQYKL